LPEVVRRDAHGYVLTDPSLQTNVPGLYAIGAVRAGYSGELASAAGEAASVIRTMTG
jgi:thioredoxin reductase